MAWQDRMVTASFKGVQALSDDHDFKSGRRLVVHEYPGGEQPDVEDMGGKAADFHLNFYFIGSDYDAGRDAFLAVLNEPGADWLWHPWFGQVWVRARDWSVRESNDKGGMCTIGVDFVPGGQAPEVPSIDRVDAADAAITDFSDAAVAEFELLPMSNDAMTSMVATVQDHLEQMRKVISLASLPLTWANQVRNVIDGVLGDVDVLLGFPAQYAAALRGFTDLLGSGADDNDLADTARPRVVARLAAIAAAPVAVSAGSAALRINLQRESDLRNRLIAASAAKVALADYRVAADRDAALASVIAALDALLPTMADAVFQAAANTRATLIEALLAQALEPAVTREITNPLPSTVLAHRLAVDESAFLAQNGVRHPLFVSGKVYG